MISKYHTSYSNFVFVVHELVCVWYQVLILLVVLIKSCVDIVFGFLFQKLEK